MYSQRVAPIYRLARRTATGGEEGGRISDWCPWWLVNDPGGWMVRNPLIYHGTITNKQTKDTNKCTRVQGKRAYYT